MLSFQLLKDLHQLNLTFLLNLTLLVQLYRLVLNLTFLTSHSLVHSTMAMPQQQQLVISLQRVSKFLSKIMHTPNLLLFDNQFFCQHTFHWNQSHFHIQILQLTQVEYTLFHLRMFDMFLFSFSFHLGVIYQLMLVLELQLLQEVQVMII